VDLVNKIAKLSATVLILGESGTGKELLARLIHKEAAIRLAVHCRQSRRDSARARRKRLFGHEPGAFTGAHRQQLGKFELASNGTLFSTRLAICGSTCRPSCCGRSGRGNRTGRPAPSPSRPNSAHRRHNVDLEKAVKDGKFREDLITVST